MLPEDLPTREPGVLTRAQQEFYFEHGYLLLPALISGEWLDRLREVTTGMVDRSRAMSDSDAVFDLDAGHTAEHPRLRRLSNPVEHHEAYWEFASASVLPDVIADLVGPDVKFHHSKLNFKWAGGGEEVKWHQDISYWPHTNYSPLTAGLYLHDCDPEQAPLLVVPGSHRGELYDQYGDDGAWTGHLSAADLKTVPVEAAAELAGPAGSVTIHNCRVVHGSRPNRSDVGRPLLLNAYSAADAFTYTANPLPSRYEGSIVRGRPARWARHDPRPCQIPPDWSGGYTSIFAIQQGEG